MKKLPVGTTRFALVDDEDFDTLSRLRWYWTCGYAITILVEDGKIRRRSMHRIIMNAPVGMEVDHINGKELDNRRENLRLCTRTENNRNRHRQRNNTSGYKGVSINNKGKWIARISVANRIIVKSGFKTAKDAHDAYCVMSKQYHGAFGRTE